MTQSDIIQRVRVVPEGTQRTVTELQKVRISLNDVEKASKTASVGAASAGGVNRLSTAQSAAGAAGGVLSTVGGSQIASIASSVLGLTSALGAVGAVTGVAIAGFSLLQSELERNAKAAEDYANALKSTADLVASGATSAEIQQQIDNLKTAEGVAADNLSELAAYRDKLVEIIPDAFAESQARIRQAANRVQGLPDDKAFAAMTAIFREVSAATGEPIEDMAQLQRVISSVAGVSGDYSERILELNQLLESGVLAANDLAAANELLTKSQLDAAQLVLRVDNMTAEARQTRISAIERELSLLREQSKDSTLTAESTAALSEQQSKLRTELEALTSAGTTYADTLERQRIATENLTNRNEQIVDLVNQEVKAQEEIYKIREDINAITSEAEAEAARIRGETQESLREVEADAAEERIEIAEDTADRIEKIEREAGRSLETAKGERDAYAFKQAEERREDALTDEEKAQKKQLENLETSLRKQTDTALKAQQRQLSDLAASTSREINTKRSGLAYQENIVATSMTSQAFLAANGATNVLNEHAKMYTAWEGQAYLAGKRIVEAFVIGTGQQPVGGVVGGGTGGGSSGGLGLGLQSAMERTFDRRMEAYQRAAGG